jgi:hypothetical protein
MEFHMTIHNGTTSFICENCGEKFYTPTGLKRHSCEKKRRRAERDFLSTFDMRYCRFCDKRFNNYGENKAHVCPYQHPENRRRCFCRCCGKEMKKCMFNRHMETHTDIDWVCSICDKKLITERALKSKNTLNLYQFV